MVDNHKEKYDGFERRKFPRIRASIVEYYPIGKATSKEMSFTEDIGAGGIRIFASEDIEVNTLLLLKIYLPFSRDPIEAKGKVIWIKISPFLSKKGKNNYDIGIEFVEITEYARQCIFEYTQKHY